MSVEDTATPNNKRTSLVQDAKKRADAMRQQAEEETPFASPSMHPLEANITSTPSPAILANKARNDWRLHGSGVSQETEEKRRLLQNGVVVRVVSAEDRVDASGSEYTSYVTSVLSNDCQFTIEHRYGEFSKLNALLIKYGVKVETAFPAKHWAGRMGAWNPAKSFAPDSHSDLVSYRKVQLDLWLVDVVHQYNQNILPGEAKSAVYEFLHNPHRAPCQDENLASTSTLSSTLAWSNPLSFTLGSSIRQAASTVQTMMSTTADQSIPLDLLQHAQGLCFLTVVKAGLVVSGKIGTGLVVSKIEGGWSAPSALGTVGVGWGAQIGGDITHYLVVLTSQKAVKALTGDSSVNLGAELGVAVGPLGRGANISSSSSLQPAYAYAHSHGFFVGMSLEGSVVATRHDINAKFYGAQVTPQELLSPTSTIAPPRAAEPLYAALQEALDTDIPKDGFRPSQLFSKSSTTTQSNSVSKIGQKDPGVPQTIATVNSGQSSLFDSTSPE